VDSDGEGSSGSGPIGGRRGGPAGHTRPGVVIAQLPSALYRVRLDEGTQVTAHIADRVDRNFVRVLVGDRVRVELSPVDVGRGRIVEKL
jgi:translation initiation factor IF-1